MAGGVVVPRPTGTCFHCGEPGHFRRECPRSRGCRILCPVVVVNTWLVRLCCDGADIGNVTSNCVAHAGEAMMLLNQDVFSAGAWPLLGNLEDPELRRLAQALPAMGAERQGR